MKPVSLLFVLVLAVAVSFAGCESKSPTGEAEKGEMAEQAAEEQAAGMGEEAQGEAKDEAKMDGMAGAETAIKASSDSPASMENDEGVSHYAQGHYDVAEVHFRKATDADPSLAVAHFNLALALDKLNKHGEATQHFKKALELAPKDPQIAKSPILNAHVDK